MKVVVYSKQFPGTLINNLIDTGHKVKVEYCGREMTEPYQVEFHDGKRAGQPQGYFLPGAIRS